MSRRRVLVVCPTDWDRQQLEAARPRWESRFDIEFSTPTDEEMEAGFDVLGYIAATVEQQRGRIDGILSSSDYPGATIAAAIATALGLPGSLPGHVLRAAHKYESRLVQQAAAPEAVPPFCLLDLRPGGRRDCTIGFPCFVKPVKGAFSVLSRRVVSAEELAGLLAEPHVREFVEDYLGIFNTLVAAHAELVVDGRAFIAEGLLPGHQVTVEGFARGGEVEILGVVDSLLDPVTRSFLGFVVPSALPAQVRERMADIARRVILALQLDSTLFNIEMTWNPGDDRIGIIEVNPRMCGQFADLYEKVDGQNGYELALELATGERPRVTRGAGRHAFAASFPLRTFEPARVLRAPDAAAIAAVRECHPDTLVWNECQAGDEIRIGPGIEDGVSYRIGVVNLGAETRAGLHEQFAAVRAQLGYELVPLGPA